MVAKNTSFIFADDVEIILNAAAYRINPDVFCCLLYRSRSCNVN